MSIGREPHRALIFLNADGRHRCALNSARRARYRLQQDPNGRVVRTAVLHELDGEVEIDVLLGGKSARDHGSEASSLQLFRTPEDDSVFLAQRSAYLLMYFHRRPSVALDSRADTPRRTGPALPFG